MKLKIPKKGAVKRVSERLEKLTEKPMSDKLKEFTEKHIYEKEQDTADEHSRAAIEKSRADLEL